MSVKRTLGISNSRDRFRQGADIQRCAHRKIRSVVSNFSECSALLDFALTNYQKLLNVGPRRFENLPGLPG